MRVHVSLHRDIRSSDYVVGLRAYLAPPADLRSAGGLTPATISVEGTESSVEVRDKDGGPLQTARWFDIPFSYSESLQLANPDNTNNTFTVVFAAPDQAASSSDDSEAAVPGAYDEPIFDMFSFPPEVVKAAKKAAKLLPTVNAIEVYTIPRAELDGPFKAMQASTVAMPSPKVGCRVFSLFHFFNSLF